MNRLKLRVFEDSDIPTLKNWLVLPHVAKYYEPAENWLAEVSDRAGEFSFIKHFVVMLHERPVGFCQYYDCYFGRHYEDWYSCTVPDELFSIDYMIGEIDCLGQGYGKEIVRLLTEKIRRLPGAKAIVVQPDGENLPSRKILEANGYQEQGQLYRLEL